MWESSCEFNVLLYDRSFTVVSVVLYAILCYIGPYHNGIRLYSDCLRPLIPRGLTLVPAWISNLIPIKVWNGITYTFSNFNGYTVEVWEWVSNFIPHYELDEITYPCRDQS